MTNADADVRVENHGSIFLFQPLTEAGRAWILANETPFNPQTYLGTALAVEPRYALALAQAMLDDGLEVT